MRSVPQTDAASEGAVFAQADAHGHFEIQQLAAGYYSIAAHAAGFDLPNGQDLNANLTGPADPAPKRTALRCTGCMLPAPVEKTLAADGTLHATLQIQMEPYIVIAGRVTDPNGVPLAGAMIEVLHKVPVTSGAPKNPMAIPLGNGAGQLSRESGVAANDLGEFRIAHLVPGTYYLVANRPSGVGNWDLSFHPTYYPHAIDFSSAKALELTGGQQVRTDIQIVRQTGVRVSGRLILPSEPAPAPTAYRYTNVALTPSPKILLNSNGPFTNTNAAEDGFELKDVLSGTYILTAATREGFRDQPSGGDQKPIFGMTRQIVVGSSDMDGLDLELVPLRDVSGTVTFAEGCTRVPVTVLAQVDPIFIRPNHVVVDSADGSFVLSGLGPGRVTVSASQSGGPRGRTQATSIRLGESEVLDTGFEFPLKSDQPLTIDMGCGQNGGAR
jgi:hypothetical protein